MPNSLSVINCEERATGQMAARSVKARDLWEFFADVVEEKSERFVATLPLNSCQ
jgi:hypothetical protein